jgi:branched-chain amino acid transport system permease protein
MQFTSRSLSGLWDILGLPYPIARIVIILIGLAVGIVLWWLQDRTRMGAIVRAGMDDKEMTEGLGINLERVSMFVFFLAAFIAGMAGVIGAQLMGVHSVLGFDILLLALVVVIVGGMGSVQGSLLGGVLIGLIDTFGKSLFPQMAMFTMYFAMIVILILKPSGLLGRKV